MLELPWSPAAACQHPKFLQNLPNPEAAPFHDSAEQKIGLPKAWQIMALFWLVDNRMHTT